MLPACFAVGGGTAASVRALTVTQMTDTQLTAVSIGKRTDVNICAHMVHTPCASAVRSGAQLVANMVAAWATCHHSECLVLEGSIATYEFY